MGSKWDNVQGLDPQSNELEIKDKNHMCWVEQVRVDPLPPLPPKG